MKRIKNLVLITSFALALCFISLNSEAQVKAATPYLGQSTFNLLANNTSNGSAIFNCMSASISVTSGSSWLSANIQSQMSSYATVTQEAGDTPTPDPQPLFRCVTTDLIDDETCYVSCNTDYYPLRYVSNQNISVIVDGSPVTLKKLPADKMYLYE